MKRLIAGAAVVGIVMGGVASTHADGRGKRRVPLVLVVGAKSSIRNISLYDLRQLYGARVRQRRIVPLNRPARSRERIAFDRAVLELSPSEVGRYWVDREVRGQRGPPRAFARAGTIAKLVAKFPRAIGYMRADQMPKWVRAVAISGRAYTDPRYPLWVEVEGR